MIDEESEKRFDDWLESIEFVNSEGNLSPHLLTDDESDDPENDRS